MSNRTPIRLVDPSGCSCAESLARNVAALSEAGFDVRHQPVRPDANYPLNAATDSERATQLNAALLEDDTEIVMAARGGYGASRLLDLLDWDAIGNAAPKLLVGFSDICSIHSALLTRHRRSGLHAPMPGSPLYGEDPADTQALLNLITSPLPWTSSLPLLTPAPTAKGVHGWLFGGNLAVLSNLIGTPWFPQNLDGAVLFLEDVNEHAGRVGRYVDQWIHSGKLAGVRAIVLGTFAQAGSGNAAKRETIVHEVRRRCACPVFESLAFGHSAPNLPIAIGAGATIRPGENGWCLDWSLTSLSR